MSQRPFAKRRGTAIMILSSGETLSNAWRNRLGLIEAEEADDSTWPRPCAPISTIVAPRPGSHQVP